LNPIQPIVLFICLATVVALVISFELFIFRLACLLCRVKQPSFFKSMGMVSILLVTPALVDAVAGAMFFRLYKDSGYPLWEAGVVQFVLALPVHMLLCAWIHSKMMQLSFSECLAVWFVEKLLKLLLVLLGLAGVGLVLWVSQAK